MKSLKISPLAANGTKMVVHVVCLFVCYLLEFNTVGIVLFDKFAYLELYLYWYC